MDDAKLFAVANQLTQLTNKYTAGGLKHMQYVAEYEKILEGHNITKKQLAEELEKRRNPNYEQEKERLRFQATKRK